MAENNLYPPEGLRSQPPLTLSAVKEAQARGAVLEAPVLRCDARHDLRLSLDGMEGIIPREEALSPLVSGADREIAILSRVGKPVCFTVISVDADPKGAPRLLLSRRKAQEAALDWMLENLRPGMVMRCVVTHLASFGAFLDIGCGVVALLPIEQISVSRIAHSADRFRVGQKLLAAVSAVDRENRRFTMTHRELLGTWLENASRFAPGETVRGVVRGVKEYGAFIELTPNLSGLTDAREGLAPGDAVSVYIKSIRPQRMKIKLQVIEKLPPPEDGPSPEERPQPRYQITGGRLTRWVYSPPDYERTPVVTDFTSPDRP